jgi:enoyl-CoA hydratase/carnithine racemase
MQLSSVDLLAMEMPEQILYAVNDSVAVITLNRPNEKNALDERLSLGLLIALARIRARPSLRVVFLRGSGPMFCAGGDPKEFQRVAAAAADSLTADDAPDPNLESAQQFARLLKVIVRAAGPPACGPHGAVPGAHSGSLPCRRS